MSTFWNFASYCFFLFFLQGMCIVCSQNANAYLNQLLGNVVQQYIGRFLPAAPYVAGLGQHPVLLALRNSATVPWISPLKKCIVQVIRYMCVWKTDICTNYYSGLEGYICIISEEMHHMGHKAHAWVKNRNIHKILIYTKKVYIYFKKHWDTGNLETFFPEKY